MATDIRSIPDASYGALLLDKPASEPDEIPEQVRRLGYATLNSGYSSDELAHQIEAFNRTRAGYVQTYNDTRLRSAYQFHTLRAPPKHVDSGFMHLVTNQQIKIADNLDAKRLPPSQRECLDLNYQETLLIEQYLSTRDQKKYRYSGSTI